MLKTFHSWKVRRGTSGRLTEWITRAIQNNFDLNDVLCLQDLGLLGQTIQHFCKRFAPRCYWSVDPGENDRPGALLVVGPGWEVIEGGNRGDDTLVWCSVESEIGPIFIACVNAPRDRHEQTLLWNWMRGNLPQGRWILGGELREEAPQDSHDARRRGNRLSRYSWRRLQEWLQLRPITPRLRGRQTHPLIRWWLGDPTRWVRTARVRAFVCRQA